MFSDRMRPGCDEQTQRFLQELVSERFVPHADYRALRAENLKRTRIAAERQRKTPHPSAKPFRF